MDHGKGYCRPKLYFDADERGRTLFEPGRQFPTRPLEAISNCQQTQQIRSYIPINACDLNAYAVEHAVQAGMLVVVAAGNDGCAGLVCPTLGTIDSPGTAPSALTVGSTTNSHLI